MKLYKFFLTVILVFILTGLDGFEKYIQAKGDLLQTYKFEGEIVYDKAYGGFKIFKINGSFPDKNIQLTVRNTEYNGDNVEPKWSPDGKYIAYINEESIKKNNIYIMDPDGKNKRKITNFNYGIIFNIRWNSNGKEILFIYNSKKPKEKIVGKAVNVKTGIVKDVIEEKPNGCSEIIPSTNEEVLICITPPMLSNKYSFTIYQKKGRAEAATGGKQETIIYKGKAYSKKKELLLKTAFNPIWSRDNTKFAVIIGADLIIFDKDGNQINLLANMCLDEGAACLRMWSYDSKKILYSCYCGAEEIQERIYILNLETKKSFFIAEGQHPDWYFQKK